MLRVHASHVERCRFALIDFHTHITGPFARRLVMTPATLAPRG
jgi:hypothetical protein